MEKDKFIVYLDEGDVICIDEFFLTSVTNQTKEMLLKKTII